MKTLQLIFQSAVLRFSFVLVALLMPTGHAAVGQALPAAEAAPISTGFALPTTLGSLQYSMSASQSLTWGYFGDSGAAASTNLAGDVAYLSNSKQHPFSMVFSGGYSFSESAQASYTFLNLGFSQVANFGRWNLVLSDNVSYLPGTPTTGLSGIPGLGDLGVNPVQIGGDTGQGVLTSFSSRVANSAAASVQRQLTGKTSLSASGSYSLTRFLSSSSNSASSSSAGLDSSSASGGAGINHQIDARNTYGGNYAYTRFGYSGNTFGLAAPDFASQTASAMFSHQFTRKLAFSVSAGPQWTTTAGSPAGISVFADTSANYNGKNYGTSLAFLRSTNNGFGSTAGAVSSSVMFSASRRFALVWNCALSSGYTHSSALPFAGVAPYAVNTTVEAIQVSRAIVRNLSTYASYTLQNQSNSGSSAINVFSGRSQTVGFGITYSPSSLHLGRQ
jgi:hypothetical protein